MEQVQYKSRQDLGQDTNDPLDVGLRCDFIRIGDIDGVNQEFKALVWVGARWKEPILKGMTGQEVVWEDQWSPRLSFSNAVSIEKQVNSNYLIEARNDPDGIPEVILGMRVKGTFKGFLELDAFPFDYQKLSVDIGSDWPDTQIHLCQQDKENFINIKNFSGVHAWELEPHVQAEEIPFGEEPAGSKNKYSNFSFSFHVKRKAGYFLWNIFLITVHLPKDILPMAAAIGSQVAAICERLPPYFDVLPYLGYAELLIYSGLIMILTFASLGVEPTEPADRLGVTLTLLLTSVAFKFVVSQNLPTISYLTLLDIYVLGCMIFQCVMVVQNSVASVFPDVTSARLFDLISASILAGAVLICNSIFFFIVTVKVVKRRRMIHKATEDYIERSESLKEARAREKAEKLKNREKRAKD